MIVPPFSCGSPALDRYLREQASQDVKRLMASYPGAGAEGRRSLLIKELRWHRMRLAKSLKRDGLAYA
jgi:hypothetical protein